MNDALRPTKLPKEFSELDQWFEEKDGDFNVLWLPEYNSQNIDWNQDHKTYTDIAAMSSSRPSYVYDIKHMNPNGYGIYFLSATVDDDSLGSLLSGKLTKNLGKVLSPLNIRYLVFHDDEKDKYSTQVLLNGLISQNDLELVRTVGILYVFENKCYVQQTGNRFFATSGSHLLYGGISSMATLTNLPDFEPWSDGIIFGSQTDLDPRTLDGAIDDVVLAQGNNLTDVAFTFVDEKYITAPYRQINSYEPSKKWSKAQDYEFMVQRNRLRGDIDSWDWDRDQGFVYTWSKGIMKKDQNVSGKDLIAAYDFELDMGNFKPNTSLVNVSLDQVPLAKGHALKGVIAKGNPNNVQSVRTDLIPTGLGNLDFSISFAFSAKDANNAQVVISSYSAEGRLLQDQYLITQSGTFGVVTIKSNLTLPSNARFFSLSVLSDQNPINQSAWWIDDILIYDRSNLFEKAKLELDVKVQSAGINDIYVRCLRNGKGGRLNFFIDGELIEPLDTQDPIDSFKWVHLGSVDLSKGQHKLQVENADGFNAINLVSVIPRTKMEDYLLDALNFIKDKGIVFAIEAESGLSGKNLTTSKAYGNLAGMGQVLSLSDEPVQLSVEIPRSGIYSLSLRLAGRITDNVLDVTIGKNTYQLEYPLGTDLTWLNLTNIPLEKGQQDITFNLPRFGKRLVTYSFDEGLNMTSGMPKGWFPPRSEFNASLDTKIKSNGNSSLSITTNRTEDGLGSGMRSEDIPVLPGMVYKASVAIKTSNVQQSRLYAFGYDHVLQENIQLGASINAKKGSSDWISYSPQFTIPANVSKIFFVLDAGWVDNPLLGNATTWFDDLALNRYYLNPRTNLDSLILYQDPEGRDLSQMFGRPPVATIKSYKRLDDTRYQVEVSSTAPFILGFAQTYDGYWKIRKSGGDKVSGLPLNGMINGYALNRTGNYTIIIEYEPQDWLEVGIAITSLSTLCGLGWLLYVGVLRPWQGRINLKKKTQNKKVHTKIRKNKDITNPRTGYDGLNKYPRRRAK